MLVQQPHIPQPLARVEQHTFWMLLEQYLGQRALSNTRRAYEQDDAWADARVLHPSSWTHCVCAPRNEGISAQYLDQSTIADSIGVNLGKAS